MALVASEVRVAGTGEVFVAPPATSAPTDATTALPAAWVGLGYTTTDGVTVSRSVDRTGIEAWQSASPIRFVYGALTLTVAATFLQSNEVVMGLYLGGAGFTGTTNLTATIGTIPAQDKRSVVVQWSDGPTISSRLYIPNAEVTDTGDLALNNTGAQQFALTFSALAPSSGSTLASWFTNDANFLP